MWIHDYNPLLPGKRTLAPASGDAGAEKKAGDEVRAMGGWASLQRYLGRPAGAPGAGAAAGVSCQLWRVTSSRCPSPHDRAKRLSIACCRCLRTNSAAHDPA